MNIVKFYIKLLTDNNLLTGWSMKSAVLPSNPVNSIVATIYGSASKGRILATGQDHFAKKVQLMFRGESSDLVLAKIDEIQNWCLLNMLPKNNLTTTVGSQTVKWRSYVHNSGPMFLIREANYNLDVYSLNCELYADLLP